MKSSSKLAALILPLVLLTACASTSEMAELRASVEAAQSTADEALVASRQAQSSADTAQRTANDAEIAAAKSQQSADNAQQAADRSNMKMDRMFEKAMSK